MQPKLSTTVRVKFADREKVIAELKALARKLCQENTNISQVLLFGSYANNTYTPRSDADVLIILKHDERRMMDRISEFLTAFLPASVGVDVFPYTRAEVEKMQAEGNPFIKRALQESLDLAAN
jgi:predicted nucleotidyltransferase